jgi:ceramide glucosyltransferase
VTGNRTETRYHDESQVLRLLILFVAAIPFIYYFIVLYSSIRFFRQRPVKPNGFTPPVSNLKPIRGMDPDAYKNFSSFCRQDYPEYELLFCVDGEDDPAVPILEKLQREFPERRIRVLYGSGRTASNDKVAKLARLASEASYEHVVISDSDVRVEPGYLRQVMAPLENPSIGAVTCFYVETEQRTMADWLQSAGMLSDFYAGIIVAWQLDGVKFALGPTIATTRSHLREFGGYESIENRPADDLLVGRLIAEQGHEVVLLPYTLLTVADFASIRELIHKRLRWIVVMRHMRPWGHLGLLLTQGLPWCLLAAALAPTAPVAMAYLGSYLALRWTMTWIIGGWGLKQPGIWKKLPLIPLWDLVAFLVWAVSFTRRSVRWRGADYDIRDGQLVPRESTLA